jgi:serine/threonine protein kinase
MNNPNQMLHEIQSSPFSKAVEQWSYPPSPPIAFPSPNVHKGIVTKRQQVWCQETGECTISDVLQHSSSEIHRYHDFAFELPGGLLHLTNCGEVRLCHVLQKVYYAESNTLRYQRVKDKQVAIKIDNRQTMQQLHDDRTQGNNQHQPFPENPWKEVAALQMIHSSENKGHNNNIIHLMEALYDDRCLYEILPYYPNDLYWLIHRELANGGLGEARARRYFIQLLHAIYVLHSQGICHRDISSQNLLLDSSMENLILIDFGMCLRIPYSYPDDHYTEDVTDSSAGTTRRLMHCQSHCGKLRFMAPEMYDCREAFDGLAVDLWSAAVVLFEMLTGRLPYQKPHESDPGYHDLMDEKFYWDACNVNQVHSWGHPVSKEAVNLLKGMFRPDPKDRLTLAEVAAHPWVKEEHESAEPPLRDE